MEYTETLYSCGCEIVKIANPSAPTAFKIKPCPKHKAALALYEACKGFAAGVEVPYIRYEDFEKAVKPLFLKIQEAIAKAEGNEKDT